MSGLSPLAVFCPVIILQKEEWNRFHYLAGCLWLTEAHQFPIVLSTHVTSAITPHCTNGVNWTIQPSIRQITLYHDFNLKINIFTLQNQSITEMKKFNTG